MYLGFTPPSEEIVRLLGGTPHRFEISHQDIARAIGTARLKFSILWVLRFMGIDEKAYRHHVHQKVQGKDVTVAVIDQALDELVAAKMLEYFPDVGYRVANGILEHLVLFGDCWEGKKTWQWGLTRPPSRSKHVRMGT